MTVGFREFRVVNKVVESSEITSFYLEPIDGGALDAVLPGQYITLLVPSEQGAVTKTYSVSSDPSETQFYRITVKREAGRDGAPDGVGSCWLHDCINVDDVIEVAAPRGVFTLDEQSERPVLLLSGGVGLTPMVSMLHRLKDSTREVHFIHACENGQVHALREEVLSCVSDTVQAAFVYRDPSQEDRTQGQFDGEGFIDQSFLQSLLPIGNYDAYICGPTPFMVAMYQLLQDLGVAKSQIAYEFFGKASSLEALVKQTAKAQPSKAASHAAPTIQALTFLTDPDAWSEEAAEPADGTQSEAQSQGDVTFKTSGVTAQWDGSSGSLLELAEDAGLDPEFSCRAGICNACKCDLVSGEVEYFEDPLVKPEAGKVLICCARPKGAVVLDI